MFIIVYYVCLTTEHNDHRFSQIKRLVVRSLAWIGILEIAFVDAEAATHCGQELSNRHLAMAVASSFHVACGCVFACLCLLAHIP